MTLSQGVGGGIIKLKEKTTKKSTYSVLEATNLSLFQNECLNHESKAISSQNVDL